MDTPISTIRNLIMTIAILSITFSILHPCFADNSYLPFAGWPILFRLGYLGSLPVANAVAIGGITILLRRGGGRPFVAGFVIVGAVAIAAMLELALALPWDWFIPLINNINDITIQIHKNYHIRMRYGDFFDLSVPVVFAVLFTVPELMIALAAGFLARSRAGRIPDRSGDRRRPVECNPPHEGN